MLIMPQPHLEDSTTYRALRPTVVDSNLSKARSSDRYVSMAEACWATGVLMFSEKVRFNSLA